MERLGRGGEEGGEDGSRPQSCPAPTASDVASRPAGLLLALAPSTYVPLPGSSEARRPIERVPPSGLLGSSDPLSDPRSALRDLIWRVGMGAARLVGMAADVFDVEKPVRVVVVPVWPGGAQGSPVELVAPLRELERDVREGRLRVLPGESNNGRVHAWAARVLRGDGEGGAAVRARRLGTAPDGAVAGPRARPLSINDVSALEAVERWQGEAEALAALDKGAAPAGSLGSEAAGRGARLTSGAGSEAVGGEAAPAAIAAPASMEPFSGISSSSAEEGNAVERADVVPGASLPASGLGVGPGDAVDALEGSLEFPWPWPWRHHPPPPPPASAVAPPISEQEITDVVPYKLSWMLNETQAAARSAGLNQDVARTLAALVSVTYCTLDNIRAWNCSRCGHGGAAAGGGGNGSDWSAAATGGNGSGRVAAAVGGPVGVVPSGRMSRAAELAVDSFEMELVLWKGDWDLLGFVGWSPVINGAVVAFRGTDSRSIHNWVHNMKTWRTDLNLTLAGAPSGALVHGGFYESYNSSGLANDVSRSIRDVLWRHPGAPVYCAGHSLGAALATIAALDLRKVVGIEDVRLYTFGSPRVGNYVFARWFETIVTEHWRFTHNRDIVPSVAPTYMGFWHVSREVWIVDYAVTNETLVGFCDSTGEDSRCHNSQCLLGLCSSIGDHLLYLSEMYTPHPQGC